MTRAGATQGRFIDVFRPVSAARCGGFGAFSGDRSPAWSRCQAASTMGSHHRRGTGLQVTYGPPHSHRTYRLHSQ
jgi:D-alanyl-D-alanine dipeptidase